MYRPSGHPRAHMRIPKPEIGRKHTYRITVTVFFGEICLVGCGFSFLIFADSDIYAYLTLRLICLDKIIYSVKPPLAASLFPAAVQPQLNHLAVSAVGELRQLSQHIFNIFFVVAVAFFVPVPKRIIKPELYSVLLHASETALTTSVFTGE